MKQPDFTVEQWVYVGRLCLAFASLFDTEVAPFDEVAFEAYAAGVLKEAQNVVEGGTHAKTG